VAYRVVGVLCLAFGIVVLIFAVRNLQLAREMADPLMAPNWHFTVTRQEFLVRSRIGDCAFGLCGVVTISGGVLLIGRYPSGIAFLLSGAALILLFAPITRLVAAPAYRLDGPDLPDLFVGSVVGLLAALAFAVRFRGQRLTIGSSDRGAAASVDQGEDR
jgi:hypothetical protein